MTHLSITHLSTFIAVVQCGSMTGAAAMLAYSLSTVSGHVSALERQLCVRLLERSRSRCEPTDEGEHVARLAGSLLEIHDAIVHGGAPRATVPDAALAGRSARPAPQRGRARDRGWTVTSQPTRPQGPPLTDP